VGKICCLHQLFSLFNFLLFIQINLSRRGLGKDEAKLLREAILVNPHLVVLKLPYNCLGDEGASIIASAIFPDGGDRHHSLSVLELAFNAIGNSGCGSLALRCIARNYNLQTLCLTGNQFGQDGILAISAAILHGTGLRKLRVAANKLGPVGMKAIAEAVTSNESRILHMITAGDLDGSVMRPMEELYLGDTSIASDGFSSIPPMLLVNSSLRALSLSSNNLGDQDIVYLSHALSQNRLIPLESLQLSFNEITCQGVECLMNAIWGSETLRELKLDNNKMKDRGAQLCGVVLTSVALLTLDLSFNKITTVGVKALMKNLSENSSVRSLAIAGIPLDHTASKAVSFALACNTSLKALYLDNCSAGYSSQRHIVAGVVSNRQSSLRILTGFGISRTSKYLSIHFLTSWGSLATFFYSLQRNCDDTWNALAS
jgi:Ran GTPase-activating protein (RanGAP) involved in mRNA processing and transport